MSLTGTRRLRRFGALPSAAVALLLALGWPAPAADDFALCDISSREPDEGIPACTRLLEPGREGVNIPAAYNNRGNAWVRKGMYDSAIDDFTAAIQRNPNYAEAYKNRGLAWKQNGDFDRAIADLNQALRLDRRSASAYNARGTALYDKGEYNRAIADFDQAVRLDADYVQAYNNRGIALHFRRQLDRAITDFEQVIRLRPNDTSGYNNRAGVLLDKGDIEGAIADFNAAIRIDPENWRNYSSRGEAWRLKQDFDRAMADHDEAIRRDPNAADAYNNRAIVWRDKGDLDRALADLDEAILISPRYDRGYANRGEIWRIKGRLEQSLADLNKAISLNPQSPVALALRGETLRQKGELDRALADFDEALRLVPDATFAYTGRGLTYESKGDLARARTDFETALKLPPETDAALAKPAQDTARTRLAAITAAEALRPALAADAPIPDPGRRVALVVGNSSYTRVPVLRNASSDADAVADALRKVGFQTVVAASDLTREKFVAALRDFEDEAEDADWAVIYFAGHGIEMGGMNYLVPTDARLRTDRDVQDEAVSLDRVLAATERAKKLRLVVLDACRDNPFVTQIRRTVATRSIGLGLGRIEPETGTLVVYAAKDGQVAMDGDDGHSPFAKALVKYVATPRLEINKLFRLVRDDVLASTKRQQEPFVYGSLPGEDFYFVTK